jgi:hypothetical protein
MRLPTGRTIQLVTPHLAEPKGVQRARRALDGAVSLRTEAYAELATARAAIEKARRMLLGRQGRVGVE